MFVCLLLSVLLIIYPNFISSVLLNEMILSRNRNYLNLFFEIPCIYQDKYTQNLIICIPKQYLICIFQWCKANYMKWQ